MANVNKENDYFTDEELNRLKVNELKRYLRRHNQFVTGNKVELVTRAKGIGKLKMVDVEKKGAYEHQKLEKRNQDKLVVIVKGKEIRLPNPRDISVFSLNLNELPDFKESDIFNYFVLKMGAKRQVRSTVYFHDKHVHSVMYHDVSDVSRYCFVKCKVIPPSASSNIKDYPDHNVWICLAKESGQVHSADCNCTAGSGEACNHIAALMFALTDITKQKHDGTLAPTSKKCLWNDPRKRKLSPKKSQDLKFKKFSLTTTCCPASTSTNEEANVSTKTENLNAKPIKSVVDIDRFREKLKIGNPNAGWLTFFETNKIEEPKIPELIEVDFMYCDKVNLQSMEVLNKMQNIFQNINISESDCDIIEKLTRGQSKNFRWKQERGIRITSSNFGDIISLKEETKPDGVLKKMYYKNVENEYVRWGRAHEPAARLKYKIIMRKSYKDIKVTESGLVVSSLCAHLGASPDGLVEYSSNNGTLMQGLLEVKCPASQSWRQTPPIECAKDNKFYCTLNTNGDKCILKRTHKYYYQIQGQLALSGKPWCDFMIWTLAGYSVERIYFDSDCWKICLQKLNKFYVKVVMAEMFSQRVKRGIPLF